MTKNKKTEHSGAKNGGGHWGPREEAKALSKRARRINSKKIIENERQALSKLLGRSPAYFKLNRKEMANDHTATKGLVAKNSGFSLHAGVATKAHERDRLEKVCRYIARPAVGEERLSTNDQGDVIYRFKKPWSASCEAVQLRMPRRRWNYCHEVNTDGVDGTTGGTGSTA